MSAAVAAAGSALQVILLGENHSAELIEIEIFSGFEFCVGHIVLRSMDSERL